MCIYINKTYRWILMTWCFIRRLWWLAFSQLILDDLAVSSDLCSSSQDAIDPIMQGQSNDISVVISSKVFSKYAELFVFEKNFSLGFQWINYAVQYNLYYHNVFNPYEAVLLPFQILLDVSFSKQAVILDRLPFFTLFFTIHESLTTLFPTLMHTLHTFQLFDFRWVR